MSKLRVSCFSVSLDGFGAGPDQSLDNPLGIGGEALHDWFVPTRTFLQAHGKEGGTVGVDDAFAARSFANVGAWIMGRNMFGPVRGACSLLRRNVPDVPGDGDRRKARGSPGASQRAPARRAEVGHNMSCGVIR